MDVENDHQQPESKLKASNAGTKRSSSDAVTTWAKQPALSSFLQEPVSQSPLKTMNDGLIYLVAKDIQPISIDENKGFIASG